MAETGCFQAAGNCVQLVQPPTMMRSAVISLVLASQSTSLGVARSTARRRDERRSATPLFAIALLTLALFAFPPSWRALERAAAAAVGVVNTAAERHMLVDIVVT
jgi:hypothetical protein